MAKIKENIPIIYWKKQEFAIESCNKSLDRTHNLSFISLIEWDGSR